MFLPVLILLRSFHSDPEITAGGRERVMACKVLFFGLFSSSSLAPEDREDS